MNSYLRTALLGLSSLLNDSFTDRTFTDRRAPALAGRLPRKRLPPEKTRLRRRRPAKAGALRSVNVRSVNESLSKHDRPKSAVPK